MKLLFLATLLALAGLSLVAWRIQPAPAPPGKIPLLWVSDDNPTRREQIGLFNTLYPGFDLKLDPNNTGMEKVIVQSLAGVGPDLFDCFDPFQLSAYVKSGIAWDVTEPLARAGVDVRSTVWPAIVPDVTLDGRLYGCPTNAAVNALWFNKAIFEREGIPFPQGPCTWQEFIPLAQRLTHRDESGHVTQFGFLCDWWNWPQVVLQRGGHLYTEDGTRCIVDSPEAIAGVQFMHDLIYRYRVMPSPVEEAAMATQGGWGSGTITLFGGAKAAMALGGRWWLNSLRSYEGLRLGAAEGPHGPLRLYRTYGRGTLVNRKSPHREAAIEFLKYEASDRYNELVNHQADALAPVIRYCYSPQFLHDPQYPNEDFNQVWRDIMRYAQPDPISPFINGQRAQRILNKQLDLVKADQKPVPEALRSAARQINAEIAKTIAEDPALRRRYDQLTGPHARPRPPKPPG